LEKIFLQNIQIVFEKVRLKRRGGRLVSGGGAPFLPKGKRVEQRSPFVAMVSDGSVELPL
jgi:hypothetical protein